MEKKELAERIRREKHWHNQTAGKNIRQTQEEKYYRGIVDKMWNDYINCINGELSKENTELLDYGCGNGNGLIKFADKIKKGVGIDISETLIENAKMNAKKINAKNLEFFATDAMNTSLDNESFNIIKGSAILHHLDLKKSLIEIKRILRKGGKAFFFEPLGTNPIINLYRRLTPEVRTADERPFLKKDIKLIEEIFPNAKITYYSFFTLFAVPFRKTALFYSMLSVMNFLDKIILNKRSPLKYLAWICVIELRK